VHRDITFGGVLIDADLTWFVPRTLLRCRDRYRRRADEFPHRVIEEEERAVAFVNRACDSDREVVALSKPSIYAQIGAVVAFYHSKEFRLRPIAKATGKLPVTGANLWAIVDDHVHELDCNTNGRLTPWRRRW